MHNCKLTCIIAAMSLMFLARVPAMAQTLKVGVTDWPPYQYTEGNAYRGLFIDAIAELKKRTGIDFEYVTVPTNRMRFMFRDGSLDVESFVNPAWRDDEKDLSVYTIPIMESDDVILMPRASAIAAKSVADFAGKRMGCTLGYFYPEGFSYAMDANTISRIDAHSAEALMQMLLMGRIDAIILDQFVVQYAMKKIGAEPDQFAISFNFVGKSPLSMRLKKSRQALVPKLDAAIKAMIADGFMKKLIDSYLREWVASTP